MTCHPTSSQTRPSACPGMLRRFGADQSGATAIEYGLMVSLISLAIMAAVNATGQGINNMLFGKIVNALNSMIN